MKLSDKIKHVTNSFPCPSTFTPLRKDGLPTKDLFEWMCARIVYLERQVSIKKEALELIRLRTHKEEYKILDKIKKEK